MGCIRCPTFMTIGAILDLIAGCVCYLTGSLDGSLGNTTGSLEHGIIPVTNMTLFIAPQIEVVVFGSPCECVTNWRCLNHAKPENVVPPCTSKVLWLA